MAPPLIELSNASKSFGPIRALDGVSLSLFAGEVHAIAGENGAGKSTLIRILSGVHPDFSGDLSVGGEPARFFGPEDATRAGIATIHQELSLVGGLSVADNLALGRGGFFLARKPALDREAARSFLREIGLDVEPDARVESLPLGVQQQLEIARALGRGARVIIMDEPTSALGEREAEALFGRIAELTAQGAGVLYISHRMEEIFRLADRITVLRDGRHVVTAPASELDPEKLVAHMVGRSLGAHEHAPAAGEDKAFEVRELSARIGRLALDRISLDVHAGEVVGLAGIAGSGASELLSVTFGSGARVRSGGIRLTGEPFVPKSPADSIARGLMLLGSDRRLSLVPALGATDNVTLSCLSRFSRAGFLDRASERSAAAELLERLKLPPRHLQALSDPVSRLSGGNQQKVALARCLLPEPRVLLLDEPTRGIDVAAKADVYALVRELADRGVAIVLVASELEELVLLCDRVIVLSRGRVTDELARSELSRARILGAAMAGGAA